MNKDFSEINLPVHTWSHTGQVSLLSIHSRMHARWKWCSHFVRIRGFSKSYSAWRKNKAIGQIFPVYTRRTWVLANEALKLNESNSAPNIRIHLGSKHRSLTHRSNLYNSFIHWTNTFIIRFHIKFSNMSNIWLYHNWNFLQGQNWDFPNWTKAY